MTDQSTPAPLAPARRAHVLTTIARDGIVRVSQLIDELGVTPATVRRDLAQLEDEGLVVRVHGGAVSPTGGIIGPDAEGLDTAEESVAETAGTIAVLVPSLTYYWPTVARGMERQARHHGYRLILRGASYEMQDERPVLERLVRTEDATGLIVAPNMETAHSQEVIQWLAGCGVPVVLAEREAFVLPLRTPVESAVTDHAHGAALAAHHLAELGHRSIGLVLSENSPTSRKIGEGWHAACEQLDLPRNELFESLLPERNQANFSEAVDATLDRALAHGVTGLLVHPDIAAMAVVDLAHARGLSVPEDLSVIAYDDEVAEVYTPRLTAVSPPREDLGAAAVDLLLRRIQSPDRSAERVTLTPALRIRQSTVAPRLN